MFSDKTSIFSNPHWTAYMNTIIFNGFVLSEGKKGVQSYLFEDILWKHDGLGHSQKRSYFLTVDAFILHKIIGK